MTLRPFPAAVWATLLLLSSCATSAPPMPAPPITTPPPAAAEAPEDDGPEAAVLRALEAGLAEVTLDWRGPAITRAYLSALMDRAKTEGRSGALFLQSWQWKTLTSGGRTKLTVSFGYARGPAGEDLRTKSEARADQVAAELLVPGLSEYDRELAIHDWIVDHVSYDEARYATGTVPDRGHTPYGALVEGTGVCDAYATAFQMLARRAGLACRWVSGLGHGGDHSWNQVRIDGRWYNIDVTWDDPVGGPPRKTHNYFNVDDATLAASHQWDRSAALPCTGGEANWFRKNGSLFESRTAVQARLTEAMRRRESPVTGRWAGWGTGRLADELGPMIQSAARAAGKVGGWTFSTDDDTGAFEVVFRYR